MRDPRWYSKPLFALCLIGLISGPVVAAQAQITEKQLPNASAADDPNDDDGSGPIASPPQGSYNPAQPSYQMSQDPNPQGYLAPYSDPNAQNNAPMNLAPAPQSQYITPAPQSADEMPPPAAAPVPPVSQGPNGPLPPEPSLTGPSPMPQDMQPMQDSQMAPMPAPMASNPVPMPLPAQAAADFPPGAIDQLVAPVALYPDDLLGQVLMASTYPMEVAEAARWRSHNMALNGQALQGALGMHSWDPSVKAVTAFPQVISMMSSNIDWTEKLGEAFIANQGGVMDAVQHLRMQAQAANRLPPPQQEAISDDGGYIGINPVSPDSVYVPYYNPATVFSPWPYPTYQPYYFPPPAYGYNAYNGYGPSFFFFAAPVVVAFDFWHWDHFDWRRHHIAVDWASWRRLNHNEPPHVSGAFWSHDPAHRLGVPFKDAALQAHFQKTTLDVKRENRGFVAETNGRASWQEKLGGSKPPAAETALQRQTDSRRLNDTIQHGANRAAQQRQVQIQRSLVTQQESNIRSQQVRTEQATPSVIPQSGGRGRPEQRQNAAPLFKSFPAASSTHGSHSSHGGFPSGHATAAAPAVIPSTHTAPAGRGDSGHEGHEEHGHDDNNGQGGFGHGH